MVLTSLATSTNQQEFSKDLDTSLISLNLRLRTGSGIGSGMVFPQVNCHSYYVQVRIPCQPQWMWSDGRSNVMQCPLCDSPWCTTHHILNSCPVALSQGRHYRLNAERMKLNKYSKAKRKKVLTLSEGDFVSVWIPWIDQSSTDFHWLPCVVVECLGSSFYLYRLRYLPVILFWNFGSLVLNIHLPKLLFLTDVSMVSSRFAMGPGAISGRPGADGEGLARWTSALFAGGSSSTQSPEWFSV